MDGQAPFPSNQRPNPPGISGVWWGRLRQCLRRRRRIIFKPVDLADALRECNLPLSCVKDCQPSVRVGTSSYVTSGQEVRLTQCNSMLLRVGDNVNQVVSIQQRNDCGGEMPR